MEFLILDYEGHSSIYLIFVILESLYFFVRKIFGQLSMSSNFSNYPLETEAGRSFRAMSPKGGVK